MTFFGVALEAVKRGMTFLRTVVANGVTGGWPLIEAARWPVVAVVVGLPLRILPHLTSDDERLGGCISSPKRNGRYLASMKPISVSVIGSLGLVGTVCCCFF